jgi:Xaa-Pro aminopeptidase
LNQVDGYFSIVEEKLGQATGILQEKELDLWLTFVRETDQVKDPCVDLILGLGLTWQSALMISRSGERIAIVGRYDADNVINSGCYTQVIGYDQSIRGPLLEQLTRLAPDRVALNYSENDPSADGLTHGMFRLLSSMLADTKLAEGLVSAEHVIAALRGRKSPSEIERIRGAVQATEEILQQVRGMARPGMTEREVADFVRQQLAERGFGPGWGADHCPTLSAGPDAPPGHRMPGDFEIQPGTLLQIDFGVERQAYVADLQRTMYFARENESGPPEVVQRAWQAARAALEAGRAALRPGARGWEVDATARSALVEAGYAEYMHAFGHHIGRSAHDGATVLGPKWERYGTSIEGQIEEGNVFAIELGVRVPEHGYIGLEEDVLVTSSGAEYLSQVQDELWVVK